jgi:hypothetical protein
LLESDYHATPILPQTATFVSYARLRTPFGGAFTRARFVSVSPTCPTTHTLTHTYSCFLILACRFGVRSASISVAAEWKPSEGEKWEEKDFEGELKKLEKEAEDRLDAKIAEMMTNIDTVGSK